MGCAGAKTAPLEGSATGVVPSSGSISTNLIKVKRRGGKPSLQQLRALNGISPEESPGGGDPAFGADASSRPTLRSGASCLRIMEKNAVLVAVRARPLNQRERDAKSSECLDFQGVSGLGVRGNDRQFAFDCVFRQEATQREVFDRTARPLLHKVLQGYNGCLFAYGQTGSGKTFTMQGDGVGANAGIIPLLCTELFQEVAARGASRSYTVHCSLLEIYNEVLKDLLVRGEGGADLQIFEEAAAGGRGIFVEGLSETQVASREAVLGIISAGQAKRAVGQTNMNEHSSRSHMVLTLKVSACDVGDANGDSRTSSKLHLIDLAGSERQKATGATGLRLKEGAQINLSLSALGNVINALTESSKGQSRHVPYRDSKLTRLLQDSLGGNSFTVMVCNISPAESNADETVSSLRFAERAKKIENTARVNRDPKAARIAELAAENKALRAKIDRLEAHIMRLEEHYEE